jgi:hypothetical protein
MAALASPGVNAGADPDPDVDKPGRPRLLNLLLIIPVLVAATAVYAIVTHAFMPRTVHTYQVPAIFNLQAGDCFETSQNDTYVAILPCVSPHDAEVFATFALPASGWPGVDAVQSAADAGCAARASDYLGPDLAASSLNRNTTYPDQVTWRAGVRTVICTVSSADGKTTGSFRQSAPAP